MAPAKCTSASPADELRAIAPTIPSIQSSPIPNARRKWSTMPTTPARPRDGRLCKTASPSGAAGHRMLDGRQRRRRRLPDVEFVRPCNLCPHMKRITLPKILDSLLNMHEEVAVDPVIAASARRSVERMIHLKVTTAPLPRRREQGSKHARRKIMRCPNLTSSSSAADSPACSAR